MSMNVKYYNGTYSNYNPYLYLVFKLLRTDGLGTNIVSFEYREYVSRLFYNYINAMSSAPYYF